MEQGLRVVGTVEFGGLDNPYIGYVTTENYSIIYTQMTEDLEASVNEKSIRIIE